MNDLVGREIEGVQRQSEIVVLLEREEAEGAVPGPLEPSPLGAVTHLGLDDTERIHRIVVHPDAWLRDVRSTDVIRECIETVAAPPAIAGPG